MGSSASDAAETQLTLEDAIARAELENHPRYDPVERVIQPYDALEPRPAFPSDEN